MKTIGFDKQKDMLIRLMASHMEQKDLIDEYKFKEEQDHKTIERLTFKIKTLEGEQQSLARKRCSGKFENCPPSCDRIQRPGDMFTSSFCDKYQKYLGEAHDHKSIWVLRWWECREEAEKNAR
jgi:hypothetical protein